MDDQTALSQMKELHGEIGKIGRLSGGGIDRVFLSENEAAALELIFDYSKQNGLFPKTDLLGNVLVFTDERHADIFVNAANKHISVPKDLDEMILIGSHIDSVPDGGNYDGSLGVVTGLQTVMALKEEGYKSKYPLAAVAFRGEESSRFGKAYMGSTIFVNGISEEMKLLICKLTGKQLYTLLMNQGIHPDTLETPIVPVENVKAFLEAHIEQGPTLSNGQIGIVKNIRGARRYMLSSVGEAGHTGTYPMGERKDALSCILDNGLLTHVNSIGVEYKKTGSGTVTDVRVKNAASNVIPHDVEAYFEFRSDTKPGLLEMQTKYLNWGFMPDEYSAKQKTWHREDDGVETKLKLISESKPLKIRSGNYKLLTQAANESGIVPVMMDSGAGHDAAMFKDKAFLIFVPGAITHNPAEFTPYMNFLNAYRVQKRAVQLFNE